MMIWIIAFYLSLVLIYVLRGIEQGILWSMQGSAAFTWNEHRIFDASRIMLGVMAILAATVALKSGFWIFFLTGVGSIFGFPFFHNTSYYLTRHKIDARVYKNWFKANSSTSTADWNISFKWRIIGLAGSIIGLILITFI